MAGVAVTTDRAEAMLFTASYLDETVGFVVPDHLRDQFSNWDSIRSLQGLTIAGPNVPYYIDKIRQRLPHAEIRVIDGTQAAVRKMGSGYRHCRHPAEHEQRRRCSGRRYSVVVPAPGITKVPLAYPIGAQDPAFASFMNTWLDLKRKTERSRGSMTTGCWVVMLRRGSHAGRSFETCCTGSTDNGMW